MSKVNSVRQTLYLKYRPQRFSELVGQEVVAQTLRNSVREGRLSHAYLFTGIRGTGKTSAARILAKAINCEQVEDGEPCGKCQACLSIAEQRSLDVIEIDAATNRGIDEIRDLRERAQFLPSQFKTKVYIIDEAHMLTADASNAFLKTLEEPPDHACFILATTEPQRLTETVRSRCQQFDFRRIPLDAMAAHLAQICAQEGVQATPEALTLVAEGGAGSLRDALSLMDRLLGLAPGKLDRDAVQAGLGMADPRALVQLATELAQGEMGAAWGELHQLQAAGVEPRQMMRSLGALAKLYLWKELGGGADAGAAQLQEVPAPPGFWLEVISIAASSGAELRRADDPWMSLEASLLRLCRAESGTESTRPEQSRANKPALPAPAPQPVAERTVEEMPVTVAQPAPARPATELEPEPPLVDLPAPAPAPEIPLAPALPVVGQVAAAQAGEVARWPEILAWLGRDNMPVKALLIEGRAVSHRDGVLTVEFDPKFRFHRELMQSQTNQELVQRACLEVWGEEVTVVVTSSSTELEATDAGNQEPDGGGGSASALSQAMSVFPGSRVTRLGTADKR
ncbi:MAG TPA: DNA polymerase III subunit gamma/tau [Candidatus Dormibacteraeota bacterium]|nr:DNA polymerase III subunit gamma/tau [Candidatus Dormibacteraeota bacterium]